MRFKAATALLLCFLGFGIDSVCGWQSDNGDGTFKNPVLYADYPDPDIIRVTNDFYMVSSTFVDSPGINVLHSRDLVNWELVSHVATNLDGGNAFNLIGGTAYEGGLWAPSIRYRNGTFYVAVQPTFANGRIYYAADPAGPWNYYQLDRSIYDPGLFFDENGTGYIVCGGGSLALMTLNSNYSQIISQTNNFLNAGGEGSHVVKRGNYYYVFNANPGVWPFQLLCSRSTNIFGPYETRHECLNALTGGHQGAVVDLADGNWFGFVHQDSGGIGRMTRIGPVFWENNWPVFGTANARDQMAASGTKPILGQPILQPATADDFSAPALGLQWQWNHNPDNTRWSLTERPGYLRLRPTLAANFWVARNTLTQKGQGPKSGGIVKFDLSHLQPGDLAGFGTLGKVNGHIAVGVDGGGNKTLSMTMIKDKVGRYSGASGVPIAGNTLYLRTDLNFTNELGICAYSIDGTTWTTLGGNFQLPFGYGSTFQGEKFAIFCYNTNTASSTGYVDVDSFTLSETASLVTTQRGRPKLNAGHSSFVADNGQLLRGPYESTEWTTAAPYGEIANMKELGFNTVHLYAESFDPSYPAVGSTAPGYAVAEVDKMVQMTRDLGLYLVITIGNGANNGNHNYQWATNFWNFYAPRYANETHVLYEIHNEPVAWGPPYLTATTPAGALEMEVAAYNTIRSSAPNTPVLLFTYAVFGGEGGATAALTDIHAFNGAVFGNTNAVWTNEAVAFHGYGGWEGTAVAVAKLTAAGYPCFMTEFGAFDWGGGDGLDVELTAELERLAVSWTTFQYIPPDGVSSDVSQPEHYKNLVTNAGLSWAPDYGTWPVARGVYGNSDLPRATTTNWVANFLTGTLRLQAEDFDTGGEGVAYHDTDAVNQGGQYRANEAVDIMTCADTGGGYNLLTASGEWLEYTMFVREPGFYNLGLRYATPNNGCTARVICNARDKTGAWPLANSGSYSTWITATQQVFLEFGRQKLRFEIPTGGFYLNWIELSPSSNAPIPNGTYKLVNRNSGLAMEYLTAGNTVVQNAYSGVSVQQWNFQHLGAGQYKVTSGYNNDTWNVSGLPGDGVGLVWWWGINATWQRFVLRPAGDGFYRLAPALLGFDFEARGASLTNGTPIVHSGNAGYAGSAHQQWGILATNALTFPSGLIATLAASTQVNLAWNAVAGATSYTVKRSTTTGGPYATVATGITLTSYSDTGLTAGVKYYYVVSAVAAAGESLHSAEASASILRAYLKFDESGGASAVDATGNGWTGTLVNGPVWTTGKFGYAVDLDGANDYVRLPSGVVNGLTNFTIAAWVYLDALNNWTRIFDFGSGTATNMFLTAQNMFTGKPVFAVNGGAGEQQVQSSVALSTNAWSHVVVTLSGGVGVLYLNGVEVGRNSGMTLTPSTLGATTQNYIGKSQYSDPYLNGRVDDFRIYPDALSAADVAALYVYPVPTLPAAPAGLSAVATSPSQVNLQWNPTTNTATYNLKRSTARGGPYNVVASGVTATNYNDTGLTTGVKYFYVLSAVAGGAESTDSAVVSPLPFPWQSRDIGAVGMAGTADYSNGVFAATGSGADIWDTADAFRFVYVTASGDCTMIARVAGVETVNSWSKAGVMIRESLATNAANALVAMTPGNGVTWQYRSATGSTTSFSNTTGLTAPFWVKLVRSGNTFTAYRSPDGATWTQQGTATFAMAASVYIGLALTSHNNSSACAATFDNVTAPGWLFPVPPPAPASLTATAGNAQVNLIWPASSGALSYNVKRAAIPGGPYATAANVATTNYTDSGVVNGVSYYYVVSALNTAGESVNSAQASAMPQQPPPATPIGLAATAASSSQINLIWNASADAASYNVKRSITNSGPYTVVAAGVTTTNYGDLGLAAATTYYYVVSAVNTGGESSNSAPASATTLVLPPTAPSGLIATAVSTNQISLTWNASANAVSYNVKRSATNGGPYTVVAPGLTATNYHDASLFAGTACYYVVSAVNSGGESANSAQASATTLAGSLGSLVHRYSFSETNSTSVADSVAGTLWNGVLPNGGTVAGGQLTLSPAFQQYASLPAGVVSSLSNLTLMAWVNLNSVATWSRIFDFGTDTTRYMFLTPQIGGTIRFAITTNSNGAEQQINCSSALSTGAWHQVTVTLSSGKGVLYLDGVAVGTNNNMTLNPTSLGVATNNYIGKSQWPDPYLDGSIDEFRIYNVGLSPAEIAATVALGANQQLNPNRPPIGMAMTGTSLTLSWPLASAGYTLQSRTNLAPGNWLNVSSPAPQIVGNQWRVVVPVSSGAQFFRLAK